MGTKLSTTVYPQTVGIGDDSFPSFLADVHLRVLGRSLWERTCRTRLAFDLSQLDFLCC